MHNYLMNNLYIKIAFKIYDSKGANQVIVDISACLLSFYYWNRFLNGVGAI